MGCSFSPEERQPKNDDGRRSRLSTVDCRKKSTKVVDIILENLTIINQQLNDEEIKFCMKHLKEHQLFNGLSQQQMKIICSQMVKAQGKKQQYLFQQGETGHSFFLIQKGRVGVQIDGKKLTQLGQGQSFGELALLFRASRAASIKCLSDKNSFFVMKPALYRSILQQLKTAQYSRNKNVVEKISLFQCLTNKQKFSLANAIKVAIFKQGDVIFKEGEVSQGVYIVSEGLVQISLSGKQPIKIGNMEMFGQSALKENGRRQGEAKCIIDTSCLIIGKKDIQKALGSNLKNLIYYNIQKWALIRTQTFCSYNSVQMNNIILGFESIYKDDGQKIQGSKYNGLVIALQGGINSKPQGTLFNMDRWIKGQIKGQNLIKNGPGYIAYLSFEKLAQIVKTIENKQRLFRASQRCIPQKDNKLTLADFQTVRKLGQGQFGQVHLVKSIQTGGGLYAVKCISKKAVKEEQMQLSVIQEKKILQKAVFPFIVGFVQAYHDQENIFLLMEYLRGKQMFDVIREMPTLNKPIARYYFGCLMLSIEYLHANNIIYRDIKPQNSVIDHKGKAYLIDLGTAKQLTSSNMFKTFTIIGTPHYMAPEVFQGKGYSFEADYWSLGILLFEFVCGKLPFGESIHGDPYSLYALIKRSRLQFPKHLADQKVRNLIQILLTKDPKARSQQVSFQKLKNHDYFNNFSWQDLLDDKILPPYIPRDFRLGTEESSESTGVPFLKQLYNNKQHGQIQIWDETIPF